MQHMAKMVKDAYHQVKKAYPPGCLDWLKQWDPGRVTVLKATVGEARRAFIERDRQKLKDALATYRDSHLAAFDEYQELTADEDCSEMEV